jgi:hypothetical protein
MKDFNANFAMKSFTLFSSELTANGAIHTILAIYPAVCASD